jgi:hypothetical protein
VLLEEEAEELDEVAELEPVGVVGEAVLLVADFEDFDFFEEAFVDEMQSAAYCLG